MTYETGLSVEERVTSLFQPDTLLPAQYLETFRRNLPATGRERRFFKMPRIGYWKQTVIGCFLLATFARFLDSMPSMFGTG